MNGYFWVLSNPVPTAKRCHVGSCWPIEAVRAATRRHLPARTRSGRCRRVAALIYCGNLVLPTWHRFAVGTGLLNTQKIKRFQIFMRFLFLSLLSLLLGFASRAQALTDPTEAFAQAQATNRPVLLVFSGSDWCAPCIQLKRQVLTDTAFLRYARQRVVLLEADFPQRKKLPAPLVAAYEQLAEAYNPAGTFPKLVVVAADKRLVAVLSTLRQTPTTLVAQLGQLAVLQKVVPVTPPPTHALD